MDSDFIRRVAGGSALALLLIAAAAFYLADLQGTLGVLAGGGVALGNLVWLRAGSHRALRLFGGGRVHPLWLLSLGVRHLSLFGALGLLLWSGFIHPFGVIVGLSVLPPVVVVQGLRAAVRNQ